MKKLLPFLFVLSSCTIHQGERIIELLAPPQKSHELRNLHIADDALEYRPELFLFTLQEISFPQISPIYTLKADGLPVQEQFLFISRDPLKNVMTVHFEFKVLENNTLQILNSQGEEIANEAPLVLKNFLKGQKMEFILISKERKTCTKAEFIPSPILLSENSSCFSLRTIHRKGTHFILEGKGLTPFEKILVKEQSGNEIREHSIVANEAGLFSLGIEPLLLGQLGGEASVSIFREDPESESRIDYAWGGKLEAESRRDSPFCPLIFVANRDLQEINTFALLSQIQKKLCLPPS